jgi:hypothetical protein
VEEHRVEPSGLVVAIERRTSAADRSHAELATSMKGNAEVGRLEEVVGWPVRGKRALPIYEAIQGLKLP